MVDPVVPAVPVVDPPPVVEPPKTFTQEEVNSILAQNKRSTPPADYAEAIAKAKQFDELQAANQTELEKAQAATTKATKERDEALDRAKTTTLRSAVITAASKAGAVDPDDVFALLAKDAVTVGDDGQVTGAEEAVKALLEAKPHLVGTHSSGPRPDLSQGAKGNGATGSPEQDFAAFLKTQLG